MLESLREHVAPGMTKAAAKQFVQPGGAAGDGPLFALRRAQVASLGGAAWVGEAACETRLGRSILRSGEPSEEFGSVALDWACRQSWHPT